MDRIQRVLSSLLLLLTLNRTVLSKHISELLPSECTLADADNNLTTMGEAFFCSCMEDSGSSLGGNISYQMKHSPNTLIAVYECTKRYSDRMQLNLNFPVYFSTPYRTVGALFQGIVFVVGLFGNVMVVVVVRRSRTMHTPTNCYLVSLAIADILVLIATLPNEIVSHFQVAQAWIWGEVGCTLLPMLQYVGINVSALSVTAFTVERYIAICRPLEARTICTVQRANRIILAVWSFAFCYCLPWAFLTKLEPYRYIGVDDVQNCTFKLSRKAYLGYFFADLVLFYVVPLIISSVLYTMIAVVVFRPPQVLKHSSSSGVSTEVNNGNSARAQVIKMLLTVVSLFALLWLPYRSMVVYNSFAETPEDRYMDLWFLMFVKTCIYINSAINPILYNAMSAKFRRAFRKGFKSLCCKGPQRFSVEMDRVHLHRQTDTSLPRASHRPAAVQRCRDSVRSDPTGHRRDVRGQRRGLRGQPAAARCEAGAAAATRYKQVSCELAVGSGGSGGAGLQLDA